MGSQSILLIALGLVLVLSPLTRNLCNKLGIPASVGFIVLGIVIGVLDHQWAHLPPQFEDVFGVLAQLGVVALLFRVGLRSHTRALLSKLPRASGIWLGDVLTNLALGFALARYGLGLPLEAALLIATALSATSVAVSVSVWEEVGKLDTDTGQVLVDVAELDDLSAMLLLAVVLGILPTLLDGGAVGWSQVGGVALYILMKLAAFIFGCYVFAQLLEPRFTRFNLAISDSETGLTISILGVGIAIAALADLLGFSLAIGALFAGLAFSRDPEAVHTDARFGYFYEFLTPFFFIHIGMRTDLSALTETLGIGLVLLGVAALAKFLGVTGPALLTMPRKDAIELGVSMIPRAEIALVVMYQGLEFREGLVSAEIFAAMVLVSVGTCVVPPILLRRMLKED